MNSFENAQLDLQQVLNTASIASFMLDVAHTDRSHILELNTACERLFGKTATRS